MSGFAGMISADGAPPDGKLIERMSAALEFRGPDTKRVWTSPGAAFCFAFLRTGPAPQASSQPLLIDDGIHLLGDIRLDGREAIRRRLESQGRVLAALVSDEELVLHCWREWGESSLAFLRGDFSFVIWDSLARSFICARDSIGARPFFYALSGRNLFFSNTLDVLRLAPDVSEDLDWRAVGDFLLQAWCPDPDRTIYRDIRRLPAGHLLRFRDGAAHIRRYAEFPVEEPLRLKRPEEYVEAFREHFEEAVRDRLPAASAAIFLSGGLDSGSVAAIVAQVARRDNSGCALRAFTLDYRPLFADEESHYASQTARHLGIPIDILSAGSCRPYARWEEATFRTPEPCHEPFFALQLEQFQRVSAHARVAFSGDGGDVVLDGQAWPYLKYLFGRREFGTLLAAYGGFFFRYGRIPPLRGGFRTRFRSWFRPSTEEADYPGWLDSEFERNQNLRERWRELQQPPRFLHPVHPIAYTALTSAFWPSTLEAEDPGWTGVPVELRTPLFDWRVLTFLLRVPPVPWCAKKHLLRRTVRELLPRGVLRRPKTPLREDPLAIHAHRGGLQMEPLPDPVREIERFVSWPRVQSVLVSSIPSQLWRDLRPLSLNYWLKSRSALSKVFSEGCS